MNAMLRRISTAFVALGVTGILLAAMTAPANAATSTVKLRNQATGTKLLTKDAGVLTSMKTPSTTGANQIWLKKDVSSGYATYSIGTSCLTGRGLQGFPVVTVEACVAGKLSQQWRKGVSGDLQLRLNGLVAEVNTSNPIFGVRMSFFTAQPNEKWFVIPA